MAVSMKLLHSVSFIKTASPIGFACNTQLPISRNSHALHPLKAAASTETPSEEPAPVLEMGESRE